MSEVHRRQIQPHELRLASALRILEKKVRKYVITHVVRPASPLHKSLTVRFARQCLHRQTHQLKLASALRNLEKKGIPKNSYTFRHVNSIEPHSTVSAWTCRCTDSNGIAVRSPCASAAQSNAVQSNLRMFLVAFKSRQGLLCCIETDVLFNWMLGNCSTPTNAGKQRCHNCVEST